MDELKNTWLNPETACEVHEGGINNPACSRVVVALVPTPGGETIAMCQNAWVAWFTGIPRHAMREPASAYGYTRPGQPGL